MANKILLTPFEQAQIRELRDGSVTLHGLPVKAQISDVMAHFSCSRMAVVRIGRGEVVGQPRGVKSTRYESPSKPEPTNVSLTRMRPAEDYMHLPLTNEVEGD